MATKTVKTYEIISAYNVLNKLKLAKLSNEEVLSLLRAKKAMRSVVKSYQDFEQDAKESVLPANFEELVAKAQAKEQMTAEEQALLLDIDKRLNAMLMEEAGKENEWSQASLSEELLVKLFTECELETKDEDYLYFLFE